MPNEPEPPSSLEHSGERVALRPGAEPEPGDGGEEALPGPAAGAGQVAIDPKLGDGDAVTHGKMKGMLQDPGLVAAMSHAARRGPRDTERQLRGPRKPFFLNTQQFHNACDLAGVGQGATGSAATGPPAGQDPAVQAQPEEAAVRGAPDAAAQVGAGAAAQAERQELLEGAKPEGASSAWEQQGAAEIDPQDLPSSLAPPSARAEGAAPAPTSEPGSETAATHRSERRRHQGLLLVLGLGGAALLVAILVMAWPSDPSSDPLRIGVPESGTDAVPTERVTSTAGKGAGGSEPATSNATSGAAAGASSGSASAPTVSASARASATGSAARSAGPPSGTTTHGPAPSAVPSGTSSLPFPLEGAK